MARQSYLSATQAERARLHAEQRRAKAAKLNTKVEAQVEALQGLLAASVQAGDLVRLSTSQIQAAADACVRALQLSAQPAAYSESWTLGM